MSAISPAEIANAATEVLQGTGNIVSMYTSDSDLSPEGKNKAVARAIKAAGYPANVLNLREALSALQDAVKAEQAAEWASVMPEVDKATEVTAAELQAARVLARGNINHDNGEQVFEDMGPSPARTIVFNELVARDAISSTSLQAYAGRESEYLANIAREDKMLQTFNHYVGVMLEAVDSTLKTALTDVATVVLNMEDLIITTAMVGATEAAASDALLAEYYVSEPVKILPVRRINK